MPYIQRDPNGRILRRLTDDDAGRAEYLPDDDSEWLAFAAGEATALIRMPLAANDGGPHAADEVLDAAPAAGANDARFEALDMDFVRVLEDVVDALLTRGVIAITDLPPQARAKLISRKSYRERIGGASIDMGAADIDEAIGRADFGRMPGSD